MEGEAGKQYSHPPPKKPKAPAGEQVWAVPGKSDDLADVRSSHAPRPPRNRPWESLASAAAWRSPLGGDREHEQMGGEHRSDISAAVNGNLVTIKTTGNICMKWRQKGGLLRAGPPGRLPAGVPQSACRGRAGSWRGQDGASGRVRGPGPSGEFWEQLRGRRETRSGTFGRAAGGRRAGRGPRTAVGQPT